MSMNPDDIRPGMKVWVWRPHHRVAVEFTANYVSFSRDFAVFREGITSRFPYIFATYDDLVAAIVPELQKEIDRLQDQINERTEAIAALKAGEPVAGGA